MLLVHPTRLIWWYVTVGRGFYIDPLSLYLPELTPASKVTVPLVHPGLMWLNCATMLLVQYWFYCAVHGSGVWLNTCLSQPTQEKADILTDSRLLDSYALLANKLRYCTFQYFADFVRFADLSPMLLYGIADTVSIAGYSIGESVSNA